MTSFEKPKRSIAGAVLDGDWDRNLSQFTEQDGTTHFHTYQSFQQRFKEGVPWEETAYYNKLMEEVSAGRTWWGCTSEEDVMRRCKKLESLYETLCEEGYKTQREIIEDSKSDPMNTRSRPPVYHVINGEIAINIGRSGELIFYDGRNRLAMAKLLDLPAVPVVILARHEQWQRLRDQIAANERSVESLPESLRSHPDLPSNAHNARN